MNRSTEILNELESISPILAAIEKINVFSVPDGYFNGLAEKIAAYSVLNQQEGLEYNGLLGSGEGTGNTSKIFQVPKGYFDTLSDHILAKIKSEEAEEAEEAEELEKMFPVLFSLKEKNVFTVPSGYFENISDQIINRLNRKPAKIISISQQAKWWKYAAAAVLAGAIAIGSLQIFNSSSNIRKNNSVVTESSGLADYLPSSFQYKTPEQINEGIATLSDDEIIKYLENHGNIIDNGILTNGTDTKELPSATDYLMDDNALNNYLHKIDVKNADINN